MQLVQAVCSSFYTLYHNYIFNLWDLLLSSLTLNFSCILSFLPNNARPRLGRKVTPSFHAYAVIVARNSARTMATNDLKSSDKMHLSRNNHRLTNTRELCPFSLNTIVKWVPFVVGDRNYYYRHWETKAVGEAGDRLLQLDKGDASRDGHSPDLPRQSSPLKRTGDMETNEMDS